MHGYMAFMLVAAISAMNGCTHTYSNPQLLSMEVKFDALCEGNI